MLAVIVTQSIKRPLSGAPAGNRYTIVINPVVVQAPGGMQYICTRRSQVLAWSGISAAHAIASMGNWSQMGITGFIPAAQYLG